MGGPGQPPDGDDHGHRQRLRPVPGEVLGGDFPDEKEERGQDKGGDEARGIAGERGGKEAQKEERRQAGRPHVHEVVVDQETGDEVVGIAQEVFEGLRLLLRGGLPQEMGHPQLGNRGQRRLGCGEKR